MCINWKVERTYLQGVSVAVEFYKHAINWNVKSTAMYGGAVQGINQTMHTWGKKRERSAVIKQQKSDKVNFGPLVMVRSYVCERVSCL